MKNLAQLLSVSKQAVSGQEPASLHLRAGMVVKIDPTPFILLSTLDTNIKEPGVGVDFNTSALRVSTLSGVTKFSRIYLSDDSYVQLYLDNRSKVQECRYFTVGDQITPTNDDDWATWLDPENGLLGGPQIDSDGKLYQRVYAPSDKRINPLEFTEDFKSADASGQLSLKSMLYSRQISDQPGLPKDEYLQVSLIQDERNDKVWIQIDFGFDLNPATLSLS